MVSTMALPTQLWCNKSVVLALKTARKLSGRASSSGTELSQSGELMDEEMLVLLKPVRWLRLAHVVTLIMVVLLLAFGTAASLAFSNSVFEGANNITYHLQGTVVPVYPGPVPVAMALACLVCLVIIRVIFHFTVWGGSLRSTIAKSPDAAFPRAEGNSQEAPSDTDHSARLCTALARAGRLFLKGLRKLVTTQRMGRTHLRRNLLLLVFGLTMIPSSVNAAAGLPMVIILWLMYNALLLCTAVARDEPAGFDDIAGHEGFGLVMLARDLAEALEADLYGSVPLVSSLAGKDPRPHFQHSPANGKQGRPSSTAAAAPPWIPTVPKCCKDFPAGCPRCQLLIRRFPATVFRMHETLALSYRWQQHKHVLVCPEGLDPRSPDFDPEYFRSGTVSVNMSRWQRQELLETLRSNGHTYVWVDALCIPAALQPAPGTPLAKMSSMLLTRMMALYSAALTTLVLRSIEEEGFRYHQRAWTMQEFCCSREIIVRSEGTDPPGNGHSHGVRGSSRVPSAAYLQGPAPTPCANTVAEEEQFRLRRAEVSRRIRFALPFWVRRMDGSTFRADIELLSYGIREYSVARRQVSCWEPADLVRALVPMFMNTSVQDEEELRLLVQWTCNSHPEGTTDEEAEAMLEASRLLEAPDGASSA